MNEGTIQLQRGEFEVVRTVEDGEPDADAIREGAGVFENSVLAEVVREFDPLAEAINAAVERKQSSLAVGPYVVHPLAAAADCVVTPAPNVWEYKARAAEVSKTSRALSVRLRRVLLARSLSRTERDHTRGKLDRGKLARLNLPGRLPDRRAFLQTRPGETNRVAVGVLVDQSGSMAEDDKVVCARTAAIAIGDALSQLTGVGVQFGMWGFDTGGPDGTEVLDRAYADSFATKVACDRVHPIQIHEYKAVGENWRKVAPRVGGMATNYGANADGECVRWAAQQLLATEADRRVLVVLSDGKPSCPHTRQDDRRLVRDLVGAVKEVDTLGVETLALGIMTDAPKKFYANWAEISEPRDLEKVLVKGFADLILGGSKGKKR